MNCAQFNYDGGDCSGSSGSSTESDCTNGIDDDQDSLTDCNDSDCASDPACQSSGSSCNTGYIEDCNGICLPQGWQGDGICDHNPNADAYSAFGAYSLMCPAMNWDDGDCPDNTGCAPGEIVDCNGNCTSESTLGSGTCDAEFDVRLGTTTTTTVNQYFRRKMTQRVLFVCLGNICRSPQRRGDAALVKRTQHHSVCRLCRYQCLPCWRKGRQTVSNRSQSTRHSFAQSSTEVYRGRL